MRLPTLTPQQAHREDARAFHEALWGDYRVAVGVLELGGHCDFETFAHRVPTTPETAVRHAQQLHWRLHRFWAERGFHVRYRTAKDRQSILIWLEPITGRAQEIA